MVEFFTFRAKFQPLISTKLQLIYFLFQDGKAVGVVPTVTQPPQTVVYEAEPGAQLIDSGLVRPCTWAAPWLGNVCLLSV